MEYHQSQRLLSAVFYWDQHLVICFFFKFIQMIHVLFADTPILFADDTNIFLSGKEIKTQKNERK